ncbi:hypothetical protein ATANTOWER_000447 [Ataeniobius toweri]|uniref:IF rod domain-containing protein n=1 Tax=Ataeniobius toweri TaxID=208326 RepID=A0ABU7ASZ6_9TELE|nr:hypothetical protein [Ataeniobius toweri]
MAMLRVSSYRKLFEDDRWSPNGGSRLQRAGLYWASGRRAAVDRSVCDKLDFVATRALNKEGLDRFVQERTTIAALNDRLVKLIELAHCLEEENNSLECEITDLEENLNSQHASPSITPTVAMAECSLEAVVERLHKQRDEIVCDTEELKEELEGLNKEYEKAVHQRVLVQQGQQNVAELYQTLIGTSGKAPSNQTTNIPTLPPQLHPFLTHARSNLHATGPDVVDAVTAECLALREQVAVYEEQLANMETQHKMEVESLLQPDERALATAAIRFGSPDITPALDVKEYYCQLAESLQMEFGTPACGEGDGKKMEMGRTDGSVVKDPTEITDVDEVKALISELQKELNELEKNNEELLDEVEVKRDAYMDEVAELEFTITEMKQQKADLKSQMKEQCQEYKELLTEKMARGMEIAAYRSLVEEEEVRLCSL